MLKFEGIKEFDIEKLDDKSEVLRNFQIIFTDDFLDEEECEIVEETLNKHNFNIKGDIVKFEIIYNIDLETATIVLTIHCPVINIEEFDEERLKELLNKHKTNFLDYYEKIRPY